MRPQGQAATASLRATDARISNVPVEASDWTPPTRLFKDKAWDISFAAFNSRPAPPLITGDLPQITGGKSHEFGREERI